MLASATRSLSWASPTALGGLLAWLALTLLCSVASAEPPLRVLLIHPEKELSARIHGQTRDLNIELRERAHALPEPSQALALAQADEADAVVWLAEESGALWLHVLPLPAGALQRRQVPAPVGEAWASSTRAEMAALMVRGELSALLAERSAPSGPSQSQSLAAPSAVAPSSAAPEPTAPPPAPSAPTATSGKPFHLGPWPAWLSSLSYRASSPIADQLAHGLAVSVRRDLGRLVLGVGGHVALPLTLASSELSLRLLRAGARAELLACLWRGQRVLLLSGGTLGVTVSARHTRRVQLPLEATADQRNLSGALGLMGELQLRLSPTLGVSLAGGVEAVPWRTKFLVESGSAVQRLASARRVEPWFSLGFFLRWGGVGHGR